MIPAFNGIGNLPPGIHQCTWDEFSQRFGTNEHRTSLLRGLLVGLQSLKRAGCRTLYVDGSFATDKEYPNDFDACWDDTDVDIELLFEIEPVLFNFDNLRAAQKAKFKGEFFPASWPADKLNTVFLGFFQRDRDGNDKGIIAIDLRSS